MANQPMIICETVNEIRGRIVNITRSYLSGKFVHFINIAHMESECNIMDHILNPNVRIIFINPALREQVRENYK